MGTRAVLPPGRATPNRNGLIMVFTGVALFLSGLSIFCLQLFQEPVTRNEQETSPLQSMSETHKMILEDIVAERQRAENLRTREQQLRQELEKSATESFNLLERAEKSVVILKTDLGSGSGFIIDAHGLAATNYHVIGGCSKVTAIIQKAASREQVTIDNVRIIAADPKRDLALLQLPDAPLEVGRVGLYSTLPLRLDRTVQTGEDVFAIGNPALAERILDYTVTRGIVSNSQREIEQKKLIQVSAAVNPGNSGGPLIDANGNVIGVVSAKGVNVEAVTFVIPAAELYDLQLRWQQEPFVVKTSLEEWEKANNPPVALQRKYRDLLGHPLAKLKYEPTFMLLSPDGGKLYLISADAGRVQQFDTKDQALGKECCTDCVISDSVLYGPDHQWLLTAQLEINKVLRINTTTMTMDGYFRADGLRIYGLVSGDSEMDVPLLFRAYGRPFIIENTNFDTKTGPRVEFPGCSNASKVFAGGYNSKWLLMAEAPTAYTTVRLNAFPLSSCRSLVNQYASLINRSPPNRNTAWQQTDQLMQQMQKACVSVDISETVMVKEGSAPGTILTWNDDDRFIFARRIFRITSAGMKREGIFEPLLAHTFKDSDQKTKTMVTALEDVVSVCPTGKWAASSVCVYDIETQKPVKLLPLLTNVHTFTHDGAGMFFAGRKGLYFFPDWKSQFPDIEKP